MKTWWLSLVLTAASACGGDECRIGESRCDDGSLVFCTQSDGSDQLYFGEIAGCCGEARCIDTTGARGATAVCSTTGMPDARCGGAAAVCTEDGHALRCENGYSTETACADVCIVASGEAQCALEAAALLCADAHGTICHDGHVLRCDGGALIADEACTDLVPSCVEPEPGHAFCAISPTPDPRCTSTFVGWCEGGVAFSCDGGFVSADRCADPVLCREASFPGGSSAFCDDPARGCVVPS